VCVCVRVVVFGGGVVVVVVEEEKEGLYEKERKMESGKTIIYLSINKRKIYSSILSVH